MKSAPNDNIVFRDIDKSAALATTVSKKLHKLERYCGDIIRSRVVLEAPINTRVKADNFEPLWSLPLAVTQSPSAVKTNLFTGRLMIRLPLQSAA
ncbi:HPF/RaiA family ribosome-associated protein [Microbulbifer sp. MLAF003]|uniref:HPF/RaiA family ribosome-associated protein n=1 Tax=Microbulbifer sp. MLAF003 TaxID=3032582 RepID=UPI0024ADEA78|nr:HPF/RaiA family ribosome-associated protein [Microbulbifer sp. MLAF003]WHI49811.1 HPF/RaiA family ribosome-associated protein [Microbulbifer sp. MLAF003]